jgi:fluoride exporter
MSVRRQPPGIAGTGDPATRVAPVAPSPPLLRVAAVGLGGALGTLLRYGLGRAMVGGPTSFPWATLVANLVGAALIGVTITLATEQLPHRPHLRPFLAVGFCGGLTTFSTLMVQTVQLGRHDRLGLAIVNLAVTVVAGLAVAGLTVAATRRAIGARVRPAHLVDPDTLARLDDETGA